LYSSSSMQRTRFSLFLECNYTRGNVLSVLSML